MKRSIFITAILTTILWSCSKDGAKTNPVDNSVDEFSELVVPSNFNFETFKNLNLNVNVTNQGFTNDYKVKVYDFFPSAGGGLIYSGLTDGTLNTTIRVPSYTSKLYLVKEDPNGSSSLQVIDVVGNNVGHTFGKKKQKGKTNVAVVSPDCSTGCDITYNNHSGNVTVNSNDPENTVCLTGSFNGQLNINKGGVIVRICGNATVSNLNLNNGSGLVIADGGSLNVNGLNLNSSTGEIIVYNATLTLNNNFSPNGKVTNYGTINVGGTYNINGNGEFINNGLVDVGSDLNNNGDLTNNNSIVIGRDFALNGGASTINNCSITVGDDIAINHDLENYGFVSVNDAMTFNGGTTTTLYDGAMMEGASATLNSSIVGSGTTSLVKVSGNTTINGGGSLNGNLEYCDANGIETNNGSINAPASLACNVYIPTSSCNASGNGTASVSDSDNDGVADGNDLFPNDPARAGESYYPGANQYGTLAFEDLWPGKGDYDFNDVVLDFRYRLITDANNEVKDIEIDYALRAIGGSLSNGFGMDFGVPSSSVSNVTGTQYFENNIALNANGTEAAQSNAVVILFDNAFGVLPNNGTQTVNTNPSDPASVVDTNKVTITFSSAMSQSQVAFNAFNPFIYIGQDRGKELHLLDREPTDLANVNYLGTADDNSNPSSGKYYVTENNLPWALEMASAFAYPAEKEDIVQTYSLFATWAQSSGASSTDWYLDLPGYRDNVKVY